MKRTVFIIILSFIMTSLFVACQDDICSDMKDDEKTVDYNNQSLDSMELYNIQIDKGKILTNLIRYDNGKYYLDLTKQDGEILGISPELYYSALQNVEQMNNNN